MPEFIPRSLVILTAAIALIALFIGVRDYVANKHEVRPAVSVGAPAAVQPNEASAHKKIGTAKNRRAERSDAQPTAAVAEAAWDAAGKSLIKDVLARVESTPDRGRTVEAPPIVNEAASRTSSRSCAPLPNSTKPQDVDALYYQGWAREYGCGLD